MNKKQAILQSFCAVGDRREYMNKPFALNGYVYATNGHIAVRMAACDEIMAEENDKWLHIENLFSKPVTGFVPIPELPSGDPCPSCKGKGYTYKTKCSDCDGEGEFEHGNHTYECKECDGSGKIDGDESNKKVCEDCFGSKIKGITSAKVGIQSYALRYLAIIAVLPNSKIEENPEKGNAARFTFDGGEGVISPMRV